MKRGIYGALWASRFIRFHNREEMLSTMVNIDTIVAARNEYCAGLELEVDCGGSKKKVNTISSRTRWRPPGSGMFSREPVPLHEIDNCAVVCVVVVQFTRGQYIT